MRINEPFQRKVMARDKIDIKKENGTIRNGSALIEVSVQLQWRMIYIDKGFQSLYTM